MRPSDAAGCVTGAALGVEDAKGCEVHYALRKSSDLESLYMLPYKFLYVRSYRPYTWLYTVPIRYVALYRPPIPPYTCPHTVSIRGFIPSLYVLSYRLYMLPRTVLIRVLIPSSYIALYRP